MAVEIKQYITEQLTRATSAAIAEFIEANQKRPIVFFISGGSCLNLLGEIYNELEQKNIKKLNVVMLFGDERLEYELSNEKELVTSFGSDLANLQSLGLTFKTFPRSSTLPASTQEYMKEVNNVLTETKNNNGLVLTLLGMGADGHIAGIFPHADQRLFYPLYLDTTQTVVGHPLGVPPMVNRITLTFKGLLESNQIITYISGAEKLSKLKEALYDNPPLNENPALFFSQAKTTCQVFTDLQI